MQTEPHIQRRLGMMKMRRQKEQVTNEEGDKSKKKK